MNILRAQQAKKKQEELGHDAFYNIHNHGLNLNLKKNISSYPDLFIMCINDDLWEKTKPLLNRKDLPPIPIT